ncbi:hypothetical protein [Bradyrhizobium sp. RDI18]|uniref:hypothetical protein n=1 Tax=Bradyrhizobium sp. RDI18 TaxID=3367400 RepID=UPI0037123468
MRATLQTASDRLHQLKNDNIDLDRKFAELANLRELVRQKEAALRAERAYSERPANQLPTKRADPSAIAIGRLS